MPALTVQGMQEGQQVEERTVRICRQVDAFGAQVPARPDIVPAQNASPSIRVISTQALALRAPFDLPRPKPAHAATARAFTLLASSTNVLTYRIGGKREVSSSPVVPSRTNNALLNAAKLMVMAKTPTQMPLLEYGCCPLGEKHAWSARALLLRATQPANSSWKQSWKT